MKEKDIKIQLKEALFEKIAILKDFYNTISSNFNAKNENKWDSIIHIQDIYISKIDDINNKISFLEYQCKNKEITGNYGFIYADIRYYEDKLIRLLNSIKKKIEEEIKLQANKLYKSYKIVLENKHIKWVRITEEEKKFIAKEIEYV